MLGLMVVRVNLVVRVRVLRVLRMLMMRGRICALFIIRCRKRDTSVRALAAGLRLAEAANAVQVPLMGRIAAGTPIEAIQDVANNVAVPEDMLRPGGRHYALEVKGDSMTGAGINDGDIVVINEQNDAETGDIVVALINGQEATLKRLRKRGSAIALEAANPAYETRVYHDNQVKIQGKLVGLIRTY